VAAIAAAVAIAGRNPVSKAAGPPRWPAAVKTAVVTAIPAAPPN
jgi:hypothetical protein